ncbi:hypothetical protein Btru_054903, partial [Bulinus truncatus]
MNKPIPTTKQMYKLIPTTKQMNKRIPTTKQMNTLIPTTKQMNKLIPTTKQMNTLIPTTKQMYKLIPTTKQMYKLIPTTKQMNKLIPTTKQMNTLIPTTKQIYKLIPTTKQMYKLIPTIKQIIRNPKGKVRKSKNASFSPNFTFIHSLAGMSEQLKTTDSFKNSRGLQIFCHYWNKDLKSPRALVFICHGAAEHCLWYGHVAQMLMEKELYVFSHDHEGHGQSEGPRVHIANFKYYVQDVFQHIDTVKKMFPNVPLFIIGHSMGGAVSILAAMERPEYFTGVVLIAPCVTPEQDTVGPVKIFLGKIIAKIAPYFPVLWLNDEDISRDKAICQKYKDDPLNYHGGMKAKWGLCFLKALQEIESKLPEVKWPFLVLHGDHDQIVNYKGSHSLYQKASSLDKTIK